MNNLSMLDVPAVGDHTDSCFCRPCRQSKLTDMLALRQTIGEVWLTAYGTKQNGAILEERILRNTLDKVIVYVAYRSTCLAEVNNPHMYKQLGTWLRNHSDLTPEQRKVRNKEITDAVGVFDNWEEIVEIIKGLATKNVQVIKYSIDQLNRCRNTEWCKREIAQVAKRKLSTPVTQGFNEDKYKRVLAMITETGLLDDVSYDNEQAALFCKRIKKDVMALCDA